MVGEHPTLTSFPAMTSSRRGASPASLTERRGSQVSSISSPGWPLALVLRTDLDERAAGQQAPAAIHYASVFHTKYGHLRCSSITQTPALRPAACFRR